MCIADTAQTAHEILAYLAEHEDAQDTLEGIVEWWLLEQRIRSRTAEVEKALDNLIAQRLILARQGRDARTHYGINPQKDREIRGLLDQVK
jgi:Tfp pilus assembly ATPase PilU